MTPKFNENQPHGVVSPHYDGAGLVQGHHYFAPNREYVFSERDGERWTEGGQKAGAQAPVTPAGPSGDEKADLAAWARGDVKLPFFAVKKLVSEAHPAIDTKNSTTIKTGLVSAGVVSAEEAGV